MHECKFHGHKLTFWTRTGVVIEQQKSQETSISTTENTDRQITSIKSRTTKQNIVWIKDSNGEVFSVTLYNCNMPLMNSQKVSILGVSKINYSNGYYCSIKNNSTGNSFIISEAKDILKYLTKENSLASKIISNMFLYLPPVVLAILHLRESFPKGNWGLQNIILMYFLPKYIFYLLGWVVVLMIFGLFTTLPKNIRFNKKINKLTKLL